MSVPPDMVILLGNEKGSHKERVNKMATKENNKVWEIACDEDCTENNSCLVCDEHNDYMEFWG